MMNKEERIIKNILSITPADTSNLPSYEYLQRLSINQATEILMLQQRITRAIEYIGNKDLGIPRKTREKAIKILRGLDDE